MNNKKIYLAASLSQDKRETTEKVRQILLKKGFDVYNPVDNFIPNAWDYPNTEWGLMVFTNDITAINNSDIVVAVSYGRINDTGGTCWEIGYAFGIGKKVIVVEMDQSVPISLMIANGSYARVSGLSGIEEYDFGTMPRSRTNTEQK